MIRIMVVEDEEDVRELLALHLKRENYEVHAFEDGEKALVACMKTQFDLFILDWMLPGISGLDLCQVLRSKFKIHAPILMLTARADTMDKVAGLETGADDYLTKPFEVREFMARVKALLRRRSPESSEERKGELSAQGLVLDPVSKKFAKDGIEISLTPFEFKLLQALMESPGVVMERSVLVSLIQGADVTVVDRTIDTLILGLRKKLGASADVIETVRGFGYRFKK